MAKTPTKLESYLSDLIRRKFNPIIDEAKTRETTDDNRCPITELGYGKISSDNVICYLINYKDYVSEYNEKKGEDKSHNLTEKSSKSFQFKIIKDLIKSSDYDFALVAFYDNDSLSCRLSLVRKIYPGEGKVEFTKYNRQTHFFQMEENDEGELVVKNNKTFEKYVANRTSSGEYQRWLKVEDLSDSFSIEKVTKEFYKEIQDLYLSLQNDKTLMKYQGLEEDKNKFIIRLLGRILFCWFLKQKKSIQGKEIIPDKILSIETIEKMTSDCGYYTYVLQTLFFEVLNKNKSLRDYTEYNKTLNNNIVSQNDFNFVPYLNGGLFQCIDEDKYKGDYSNTGVLKVSNQWFIKLFDLFGRFNFTIDENSVNDTDISVDPEMLGKIFENLLAFIDPVTQEDARKSSGSFYTPREIVDYMCEESLKEYLYKFCKDKDKLDKLFDVNEETNPFDQCVTVILTEALYNIKILDPACGSGAFPMGLLQKILFILGKLDVDGKLWRNYILAHDKTTLTEAFEAYETKLNQEAISYIHKLGIIRNSVYGVDIQTMATDIARLRCFLSLIVDERVDDGVENRNIFPLPNLDFKFVSANTLIALPDSKDLSDSYFDNDIKDLQKIRKDYLNAHGNDKDRLKDEYLYKLKNIRDEAIEIGSDSERIQFICDWNPFENKSCPWFDPKWMFGIEEGFDIVIANPPYIPLQKIKPKDLRDRYASQGFETHDGSGDIYCLFYEKGMNLLKTGGNLCYITSNKWMRAGYGEKLRGYFCNFNPKMLIDLGPGVFDSATVDTNILLIKKEKIHYDLEACSLKVGKGQNPKDNLGDYITNNSVILKELSSDSWFIGSREEVSLKKKIEHIGTPLGEWDDITINYGIKTGFNDAFIIDTATKDEILNNCSTSAERQRTEKIIKPILRGSDVKRYEYHWANLWVIGIFPALHLNIKDYPTIEKYFLDNFDKRRLEQTGKNYGSFKARSKTSGKWYETQTTINYYKDYEKPKIIWADISDGEMIYDYECYYLLNTCYMLTGNNVKYICGLLNSRLIRYAFISYYGNSLGTNAVRWFTQDVIKLPIPEIKDDNMQIANQIENLVDQITEGKKQGKDTTSLEKEIDTLVYQLYDLTDDEIKIIEK
ncbi:MAG: N-6 DNA methylase [Abditibacteriota bacterium]|nr:N-6 DNA methylase [Abditibacteriota bacterium]